MKSANEIRAEFEFLPGGSVLFDHAGGTPTPKMVSQAMREHFNGHNVNAGAEYPESINCKTILENARLIVSELLGSNETSEIAFGPSSSQLLQNLSLLLSDNLKPGDEIILAQWNHEGHVNPWLRLQSLGVKIVWWELDSSTQKCELETLESLVNERTKFVCTTMVSNILGGWEPIEPVVKIAHAVGAQVICDCVAAVPHRLLNLKKTGVDFAFCSLYKALAPHWACLYGKKSAWQNLGTLNHEFYPKNTLGYKLELGVPNFEAAAGMAGLLEYHHWLGGGDEEIRKTFENSYSVIENIETKLNKYLIESLWDLEYDILGPQEQDERISLACFRPKSHSPLAFAQMAVISQLGIKFGHMCSPRTLDALGIDREIGVSRISLFHANTTSEIEMLLRFIKDTDN